MKTTLALFITLSVALASVSNAAITLSGTALKNVQGTTAVDLVSGRLGLLIVDTAGDGFLTAFSPGATASGNAMSPTTYGTAGSGLTVNSTSMGSVPAVTQKSFLKARLFIMI
jgi:hypothetical protein